MNDVTLREYIEALMAERDKRIDQLENDAATALRKAEQAMERRLDLLNEFRQQSLDEQRKYVERREFQQFQDNYRNGHEALKSYIDQARGRWLGVPILISGCGVFVALLALVYALSH